MILTGLEIAFRGHLPFSMPVRARLRVQIGIFDACEREENNKTAATAT